MIRRALAPLLAVVCLLALAGCNGDSGNDKNPPKTVDGIPAYATTNNDQGAQNFERNQASAQGDEERYRFTSTTSNPHDWILKDS